MATKRLARHNVVAAFESFAAAEEALGSLRDSGLSHEELSLLSKEMKKTPGQDSPVESRAEGAGTVTKWALAGIAVGAVVGGVLGAVVGVVVALIGGFAVAGTVFYAALSGAVIGPIAGGLLGAEAGARKQMMVEQTFHPLVALVEQDYVLVAAHSDDPEHVDTAVASLEKLEPTRLERLEANETFHPPGTLAAVADRTIPSTHPDRPGGEMGRDRAEHPDGKLVGMEERGAGPTSGRPDAEEKERRVPSLGDDDENEDSADHE